MKKIINVRIKNVSKTKNTDKQKNVDKTKYDNTCYRYFIDDCGQGFTAPCCYQVDAEGDKTGEYYTWAECKGNPYKCPFINKIMGNLDVIMNKRNYD